MERIELARIAEFRLGPLTVRPGLRQVVRDDGMSEVLEPRVMQVLIALALADGAILTRDDLTTSCWDSRIVGEDAINRVISRLRRVAEGIARDSFKLETITKVGYRLVLREDVATPTVADRAVMSSPTPPDGAGASVEVAPMALRPAPKRQPRLIAIAGAALLLAVGVFFLMRSGERRDVQRAVTVEALHAPPGDADAQLFRQSLSADLARLVVGNDATLAITDGGSAGKPRQATDLIVNGEARTRGSALHATIRLVSGEGTILWSDDFARPGAELESLRQEVAAKIADVLLCALGVQGSGGAALELPTLRLYLSGCELRHDKWRESASLFRQVADRRPDFAPAWANLAARTALYAGDLGQAERARGFADAKDYAQRALSLDPKSAAAWFALVHIQYGKADFVARQQTIAQALAVGAVYAPLYTDALLDMGAIGRHRAALDLSRRAAAADPFGPVFAYNLAEILAFSGRVDEASEILRQADSYWPRDPKATVLRFTIAARIGDAGKAAAMLNDPAVTAAYSPRALADWRLFLAARATPALVARTAAAFRAGAGNATHSELSDEIVDLVQLGRIDDAFALADALKAEPTIDRGPWFMEIMAPLRADPRFIALAARRGIAAIWVKTGLWPDFCTDHQVRYDCQAATRRVLINRP